MHQCIHNKMASLVVRGKTTGIAWWTCQGSGFAARWCLGWKETNVHLFKVIYHPLYSMNKFVTNKSMLPQYGAQVFPYMG